MPPPTWHQQRVPGPHGFAVRNNIVRLRAVDHSRVFRQPALRSHRAPDAAASTASHPASVTIAIRPSGGRDGERSRTDLGQAGTEIFLEMGLDSRMTDLPVGQIRLIRLNKSSLSGNFQRRNFLDLLSEFLLRLM
jgi:hypothetical protein